MHIRHRRDYVEQKAVVVVSGVNIITRVANSTQNVANMRNLIGLGKLYSRAAYVNFSTPFCAAEIQGQLSIECSKYRRCSQTRANRCKAKADLFYKDEDLRGFASITHK